MRSRWRFARPGSMCEPIFETMKERKSEFTSKALTFIEKNIGHGRESNKISVTRYSKQIIKKCHVITYFQFFLSFNKTCCDCNITFLLQLYLIKFWQWFDGFSKVFLNCTAAENNNHLGTLVPSVFLSTSFLQPQMLQSMDY